jgi:hypothetical protein
MISRSGAVLLSCAAALALGGCFAERREPKSPGVAVWVGAGSIAPDAAVLARLAEQGVTEYFVEAARLAWDGPRPRLEPVPARRAPRRDRTSLVIVGTWPAVEVDAGEAASALAQAIQGLRLSAERDGRLPVGVHFDVEAGGALAGYGRTLAKLRREMDARLYLSATVARADLGREELADLVEALDFAVVFAYGQRPGEPEDPDAWDLQAVEATVSRLDALGRPYMLGAVTVGTATWRDRSGRARGNSAELDLAALVRTPKLELKRGFSLEGIDRQVYEFRARSPVVVGSWAMSAGESVRVARAATSNLEEFLRRCGAWQTGALLGPLFWRLPTPTERMSISAANLADALAPEASVPALEIVVERPSAGREEWRLVLTLVSGNDESTDLAFFDSNYVDLSVRHARITEVDPGAFARFELAAGGERKTMRALREADALRLFVPIVEGRQRLATGPITLLLTGPEPTVRTAGSFLLTDGRTADLEAREWTFAAAR